MQYHHRPSAGRRRHGRSAAACPVRRCQESESSAKRCENQSLVAGNFHKNTIGRVGVFEIYKWPRRVGGCLPSLTLGRNRPDLRAMLGQNQRQLMDDLFPVAPQKKKARSPQKWSVLLALMLYPWLDRANGQSKISQRKLANWLLFFALGLVLHSRRRAAPKFFSCAERKRQMDGNRIRSHFRWRLLVFPSIPSRKFV